MHTHAHTRAHTSRRLEATQAHQGLVVTREQQESEITCLRGLSLWLVLFPSSASLPLSACLVGPPPHAMSAACSSFTALGLHGTASRVSI